MSDRKLIQECVEGKRQAYKELYDKYSATMLSICMRYSSRLEEAEDILQEGFIKVFKNISNFRHEGSFEGWIKKIMVNTAVNHYHSNYKYNTQTPIDNINELKISDSNPEENRMEQQFSREVLLNLVQSLPDGYRMVFNMYVFEGYSHKEIADMLDVSENTSKTQLFKARKFLRRKLTEIENYSKLKKTVKEDEKFT